MEPNGGTSFTENAWDALYDAVDSKDFIDRDASLIFDALSKKLRFIPFGEYLKRYIYRRAEIAEPFEGVPLDDYRRIIIQSFKETNTPPSFTPTSAKLSALSKNWLTRQTVSRSTVFLLGFGLSMNESDVESFLTKALREQSFNPKDPFELICRHCYKKGYGFPRFRELLEASLNVPGTSAELPLGDATADFRRYTANLDEDAAIVAFASSLRSADSKPRSSISARRCFDELFEQAKAVTAEILNEAEEQRSRIEAARLEQKLLSDDRLSDAERRERVAKLREHKKNFCKEDVTESELERIISSAIPIDRHGNLSPSKASKLNAQFDGKRFSRQHVSDILAGKAEVSRFDLITLNFYICSQSLEKHPNPKERFFSFLNETNSLLERCSLGELYITNPYECFVLMCVLSEDPLGTYADVWEMTYSE